MALTAPEIVGLAPLERSRGSSPHLTLRFLGEVDADRRLPLEAAIGPVAARHPPFRLTLRGFGAFPDLERPRVVFAEVEEGRSETERIATDLDEHLDRQGFGRADRAFRPHVTLFRVRGAEDRKRALALAARSDAPALGETRVREILLVESRLAREGATHTTLRAWPLQGPETL